MTKNPFNFKIPIVGVATPLLQLILFYPWEIELLLI